MLLGNKSNSLGSVLIKGASGSFFVKVVGAGVLFGAQIALARMLGVESYGKYIYALTWINMLALISKFGLDTSALRYVPRYHSQQEWGLLHGFFKYSNNIHLVVSIVIAIAAAMFIRSYRGRANNELAKTFIISCLLLPMIVHMHMRGAYLQSFKRVVLAQAPELIVRPIILIVGVFLIYKLTSDTVDAPLATLFNLLASTITILLLVIFSRSVIPEKPDDYPIKYNIREWNRVSFTFLLLSGFELVLLQTDIVMIGYYIDTTEAGLYAAASRLVKLVSFSLVAINTIAAPMISQYYIFGKRSELQRIMTLAAIGGLMYSLPACLVMIIWGDKLLGLFGPMFVSGYIALVILTVGRLVDSLTGLVGYLMTMTDHHAAATKIQGTTVVLNIAMNMILIPTYGMEGAAIATAFSMITWNIISLIYVKTKLRLNPTILSVTSYKTLQKVNVKY
jgi:O-antigen/teichoic acid export membrane protein